MKSTSIRLTGLLLLIATLALAACDSVDNNDKEVDTDEIVAGESFASKGYGGNGAVTVMTRNMYVGTDVDKVMAGSPEEIPILVAEAFGVLQQTKFDERAKAMAKEIKRFKPHIVGLQEVSQVRLQTPGDAAFGGMTPAEDVFLDFLPMLLSELDALGLSYDVAGSIENIDVELPMITDPVTFSFTDVRLTDSDVVLTRSDVSTENAIGQNYAASFPILGAEIKRGYISLDATIKGKTYRVVSTHLEPASTGDGIIQEYQAGELVTTLAAEDRPLILLGDLNSDAPVGATYNLLTENGYNDVWLARKGRRRSGYTCCQEPGLTNSPSILDRRLDQIFVKNFDELWANSNKPQVQAYVIGNTERSKTESGLWTSDHAGVVARLYVPSRRR